MNKKLGTSKDAADKLVKNIRRKTRQTYSAEEKTRIVLAGLRGEESISALCRREGMRIAALGPLMHARHGTRISTFPERTWRAYLAARPELYFLDPRGPEARVRLRVGKADTAA